MGLCSWVVFIFYAYLKMMQMLVCILTADCIRVHTGNTHPEDDVWAELESLQYVFLQ